MEYITAEQFLEQPKEVQKVFLEWWQPEKYDLVTDYTEGSKAILIKPFMVRKLEIEDNETFIYGFYSKYTCYEKDKIIPLLSEGQLRKFIENKTKLSLEVQNFGNKFNYDFGDGGYCIHLSNCEWVEKQYNNLGTDLLQAYWKVALKVAKEIVAND
jgi:hypothetical protein